jgi:hypothetical protein
MKLIDRMEDDAIVTFAMLPRERGRREPRCRTCPKEVGCVFTPRDNDFCEHDPRPQADTWDATPAPSMVDVVKGWLGR